MCIYKYMCDETHHKPTWWNRRQGWATGGGRLAHGGCFAPGWVYFSFTSISYIVVVGTAKVMKTLRENVMRTGVTKQRRKRRMKKYLMKCFCTKHFSSTISVLDNTVFHHYVQHHDALILNHPKHINFKFFLSIAFDPARRSRQCCLDPELGRPPPPQSSVWVVMLCNMINMIIFMIYIIFLGVAPSGTLGRSQEELYWKCLSRF